MPCELIDNTACVCEDVPLCLSQSEFSSYVGHTVRAEFTNIEVGLALFDVGRVSRSHVHTDLVKMLTWDEYVRASAANPPNTLPLTLWLKTRHDERVCNPGRVVKVQPNWSHSLHADHSIVAQLLRAAVGTVDGAFEKHVHVAIQILQNHTFYCDNVQRLRNLNEKLFLMPEATDACEKYLSSIVLRRDHSPDVLYESLLHELDRWDESKRSSSHLLRIANLLALITLVKEVCSSNVMDVGIAAAHVREQYDLKVVGTELSDHYAVIKLLCARANEYGVDAYHVQDLMGRLKTKLYNIESRDMCFSFEHPSPPRPMPVCIICLQNVRLFQVEKCSSHAHCQAIA